MKRHARLLLAASVAVASPALFAQEFCNPGSIAIPGSGSSGPASPYPSTLQVSGGPASITGMVLSFRGMSHSFPGDLDILLVGPGGQSLLVQSDVGSGADLVMDDYAIADTSGRAFNSDPIRAITYRPTDVSDSETLPAPAPEGPYKRPAPLGSDTLLSVFGGTNANGTWQLYIADDAGGDSGALFNGWCLRFSDPTLRITEFRIRGPAGALDEYVEVGNTGDTPVTVADVLGGDGFAIAASDGIVRCLLPNGLVVPPHRRVLCANEAYTLAAAPGADAGTPPDFSFALNIPDASGVALFATSDPADFSIGRRLDAIGPAATGELYREGPGFPTPVAFSIDAAFVRDPCGKKGSISDGGPCPHRGIPGDTEDSLTDAVFVDTNGTSAGAGQRLGTPGPHASISPTFGAGRIETTPIDACVDPWLPPNAVYIATPGTNSTFGTVIARRRITNRTGQPLTRLRFRIIDITTFPALGGIADLRPKDGADTIVVAHGQDCDAPVQNTVIRETLLEQPPIQWNGGGFNSAMTVPSVSAATPLANNASIDIDFRFGLEQLGRFRAMLVPEGLPRGGGEDDVIIIEGCSSTACGKFLLRDGFE